MANNDEAFIGLVGFSPSSFALQVTNRNSVSDLNGSGECVGAAWKLTGAVSFDFVNVDKNSDIDGFQIGYSVHGFGVDIHVVKSTTVTLAEGNFNNLLLTILKK